MTIEKLNSKRKIVLLTTSLGWGGTEGHVVDLALGFVKRGIYPTIVIDEPPLDRLSVLNEKGIQIILLSEKPWLSINEYRKKLKSTLESIKPDLIHINVWKRRNVILETAGKLNIPIVETIHATVPYKGKLWLFRHKLNITRTPFADWKYSYLIKKYKPLIIHVSDLSANNFKKKYPFIKKTKRIYCGAYFPNDIKSIIDKDKVIVLWIGSMIKRKRPLLALAIWKEITKDFSNAKLIMIGEGPQLEIVRKTAEKINSQKIMVIGSVPDLYPYLAKAHVMLHTSTAEGIPKNIRYAMNFGLPTVSTNAGAIGEVLTDGKEGFLTKIEDSNQIRKSLFNLINDPELFSRMSKNAREKGRELFDMEKMINNVIITYNEFYNLNINFQSLVSSNDIPLLD